MDRKAWKLNRELLGILLLAGLLAATLIISHRMCRCYEETARKLDAATAFALAEKWEQAVASTASAQAQWEESWRLSGLFADVSPMEEIDTQFAQLSVWAEARQETEFASAGAALSRKVRAMADAHRLTWWNLF